MFCCLSQASPQTSSVSSSPANSWRMDVPSATTTSRKVSYWLFSCYLPIPRLQAVTAKLPRPWPKKHVRPVNLLYIIMFKIKPNSCSVRWKPKTFRSDCSAVLMSTDGTIEVWEWIINFILHQCSRKVFSDHQICVMILSKSWHFEKIIRHFSSNIQFTKKNFRWSDVMPDDFEQIIRHFVKSSAMSNGLMAFCEPCYTWWWM